MTNSAALQGLNSHELQPDRLRRSFSLLKLKQSREIFSHKDFPVEYSKKFTLNDLGLTGSHQASWHISKKAIAAGLFDDLSPDIYNPEVDVNLHVEDVGVWKFRLIWYNNNLHPLKRKSSKKRGRDEYRLTKGETGHSPSDLAARLNLRAGDQLLFRREKDVVTVTVDRSIPDQLIVNLEGPPERAVEVRDEINDMLSTPVGEYPEWQNAVPDDTGHDEDLDPKIGEVYVLSNSAMPGICKIGCTTRDPRIRAEELFRNSTGVPKPFHVEGSVKVFLPNRFEKVIHDLWGKDRVHPGREFFNWEPKEALEKIRKAEVSWSDVVGTINQPS